MQFRLKYEGPLNATQKDPVGAQRDPRADHKHQLRRYFHGQLKRLWDVTPHLTHGDALGPDIMANGNQRGEPIKTCRAQDLAQRHAHIEFNFVPLVTFNLQILCGLDILLLCPDNPMGGVWAGDIDNRIKTLIDALRIPSANEDYDQRTPAEDEQPFFCLLEEDKLITKLTIETDRLLKFDGKALDQAMLVINVSLRPYETQIANIAFA